MFHPHLKQLRAFAAIMRHGSTLAAATQLSVSQPAISMLLKDFETNVGFRLFTHSRGRLTPTADAHVLMRHVSEALNGLDHLVGVADDIRSLRVGSLRCASLVGPSLAVVPRAIATLSHKYPGIRVSFQTRASPTIWEWAQSDVIDLGLVESHVSDGFRIVRDFDVECYIAIARGNDLTAHSVLTPKLIAGEPLVTLAPDHPTTFQLRQAFTAARLPFEPRHDSYLMGPALALVAAGIGLSLIDPFSLAALDASRVAIRRFEPRISLRLSLIAPLERQATRHVEEFTEILVGQIEKACAQAVRKASQPFH